MPRSRAVQRFSPPYNLSCFWGAKTAVLCYARVRSGRNLTSGWGGSGLLAGACRACMTRRGPTNPHPGGGGAASGTAGDRGRPPPPRQKRKRSGAAGRGGPAADTSRQGGGQRCNPTSDDGAHARRGRGCAAGSRARWAWDFVGVGFRVPGCACVRVISGSSSVPATSTNARNVIQLRSPSSSFAGLRLGFYAVRSCRGSGVSAWPCSKSSLSSFCGSSGWRFWDFCVLACAADGWLRSAWL